MNKKDFGYNTDCCCLTDREINQILMKENQALKDRWQKLKEWVMYTLEEKQNSPKYYKFNNVLDKMQELEKQ